MSVAVELNPYLPESVLGSISLLNAVESGRFFSAQSQCSSGYKWTEVRHGSFVKNAPLISLSTWKLAERYLRCGVPGSNGFRNTCNITRFCCYCSWKKANALFSLIEPAYPKEQYWYHLTIAYKSNISLTATKEEYLGRFNSAFAQIKTLLDEHVISGAVSVADVSVPSLADRMLFPHLHTILCSPIALCEDFEDGTRTTHPMLQQLLSNELLSVSIKPISDDVQYRTISKYLIKAIDLKRVYESDLTSNYSLKEVNEGANAMLNTISTWEHKYVKVKYFGILKPGTKGFVGKKKD